MRRPPKPRLLLHICCAPDATVPWPRLMEDFMVTGYFYGSNVHPGDEYLLRARAVEALARHLDGEVLFEPYDPEGWMDRTRRLEGEVEGGGRCGLCFALQLLQCAKRAVAGGFDHMCTTLTISPHKDPARINCIGFAVSSLFGIRWVERVWRKGDGFKKSVSESRRLGLYRQRWCGCLWSMGGV